MKMAVRTKRDSLPGVGRGGVVEMISRKGWVVLCIDFGARCRRAFVRRGGDRRCGVAVAEAAGMDVAVAAGRAMARARVVGRTRRAYNNHTLVTI